jgi:glycosyltransferase involved in cell wall biosynthesis
METPARIAIVHEWITAMRGGEKVLEAMCELFPQADVFSLLHIKGTASPAIEQRSVRTSFIQRLPFASHLYRHYLPLFPAAVSMFDLRRYDLVLTSHHCVAKGVHSSPDAVHICYCHTPMRYLWDLYDEYFAAGRAGFLTRAGARLFREPLRRWDVKTAVNPDLFVANSEHVRRRIGDIYRREAEVIYPPVDVEAFSVSDRDDGYYLVAGALVPYKRVDIAVEAFNQTGQKLVIAGTGPDLARLKKRAGGNIEFIGWQPDEQLRDLYAGCRALIFPGIEDFGIVPVEAMASGKPVIAFAEGGVTETVLNGITGVLVRQQTAPAFARAVRGFDPTHFEPDMIRRHAERFDRSVFLSRFGGLVAKALAERRLVVTPTEPSR